MDNLAQQIEEYLQRKGEVEQLEGRLFEQMKSSFAQEVPRLNARLPEGYSISTYGVGISRDEEGRDGEPVIGLGPPNKREGKVTQKDMDELNELLKEEFGKIQAQKGFKILGFLFSYCV